MVRRAACGRYSGEDVVIHIDSNMVPYISPEEYEAYHENKEVNQGTDVVDDRRLETALHLPGKYGANLMEEVARWVPWSLRRQAKELEGQFDVIHAHDRLTYYAGIAAKRISGKPLSAHARHGA